MALKSKTLKKIISATTLPPLQKTIADVFILESLSKTDEDNRYFEGRILSEMLFLAGKNPRYVYFQSADELPHLIGLFRQSRYRYLHISAHASSRSIATRNDRITYEEFADLFEGHLGVRRLFMSACEVGNQSFVDIVSSKNKGMHSIIAPCTDIQYDHAAAIWTAFYISMFTESSKSMKHSGIKERFQALKSLFPVDFFLAFYNSKKDTWECETT